MKEMFYLNNFKRLLSDDELLDKAMKIENKAEAKQFMTDYVALIQEKIDKTPDKKSLPALEIAKRNIGYWAGYYNKKIRKRVFRLFKTEHPIFGKRIPTNEEAYGAGINHINNKEEFELFRLNMKNNLKDVLEYKGPMSIREPFNLPPCTLFERILNFFGLYKPKPCRFCIVVQKPALFGKNIAEKFMNIIQSK
jgi:hypothetical protein